MLTSLGNNHAGAGLGSVNVLMMGVLYFKGAAIISSSLKRKSA